MKRLSIMPSVAEAYYTNMPATVVLGQPDFTSNGLGTPTRRINYSYSSKKIIAFFLRALSLLTNFISAVIKDTPISCAKVK